MLMSILFSLVGCILTGLQTFLIFYKGDGICFNEGCSIVDSLTTVPPLYFNLAGLLFFLIISFSLNQARKKSEIWQRFASLCLLAGLAAEGVLFSFQLFITEVFCSYCLIIFMLIALANIFMGIKQIFKSVVIFSAVLIAFFSLDFKSGSQPQALHLDNGSIAKMKIEASDRQLYLFFSSTCSHCEQVIEEMQQDITCSVNFNPIDSIESFSFPGAQTTDSYKTQVNINFLRSLGINGVPALVDMHDGTTTIWKGGRTIKTFLDHNCSSKVIKKNKSNQIGQTSSTSLPVLAENDDCSTSEDCDDSSATVPYNQQTSAQ